MPRTCTVCSHPKVSQINAALLGSESFRNVAKRFGASASAAYRHQREHLRGAQGSAKEVSEAAPADTLMGRIIQLGEEARRLGKKAEAAGDLRGAMAAVHELVRIVELMARIQGEITEPEGTTTISVVYVNAPDKADKLAAPAEPPNVIDLEPLRFGKVEPND